MLIHLIYLLFILAGNIAFNQNIFKKKDVKISISLLESKITWIWWLLVESLHFLFLNLVFKIDLDHNSQKDHIQSQKHQLFLRR